MPAALYVGARRVLLDALDALVEHRDAIILVGAQAIYARTGEADLDVSVAPYTTDADLTIDPRRLGPDPRLDEAMRSGGFVLTHEPGIWTATTTIAGQDVAVPVDLLVPEQLVGKGRRSACLPAHGKNAARRTPGLEAVIADNDPIMVRSLEPDSDSREVRVRVAGAAALLMAKVHKLIDRTADASAGRVSRLKPKDASDVYRLMTVSDPAQMATRLKDLSAEPVAQACVSDGMDHFRHLFSGLRSKGVDLAVEALTGAVPATHVRAFVSAYAATLVDAYDS
jgi:hypothetical protein